MSLNVAPSVIAVGAWASALVENHLRPNEASNPYPVAVFEQIKAQGSEDDRTLLRNQLYFVHNHGEACQFNLLDVVTIAMRHTVWSEWRTAGLQALGLLLDMGFDPNRFNGAVTPVGYAGYTYQADVLQLFATRGADLRLSLALIHAGTSGLGLTTLLHRIGQRARPLDLQLPQAHDALAFLARYDGSIQTDENGFTVLTDPLVPVWFKELVNDARATPVT